MSQGIVGDQRRHMGQLGGLGAKKFAASRSVEEEVSDSERGAAWQSRIVHVKDFAAGDLQVRPRGFAVRGGPCSRLQCDAGYRGDGG